jgi:hypothetical protein
MESTSHDRSPQAPAPRVIRWLSAALLTSAARAACTSSVVSGGSGTTGDPPEDDWTATGFTDAGVLIICKPDSVWACYSGPPGTLGVGSCATGTRACNGDGTAFGPCTGDVPASEQQCSSEQGLDCQGLAACGIDTLWSHGFHGEQQDAAIAITVDALGNTLIAGSSAGAIDFGTGKLTFGTNGGGGFLADFDEAGKVLWSRSLAPTSTSVWGVSSLARDPGGNIYLSGSFGNNQILDLGGGPLKATGLFNAFVVKLDPQGHYLWARSFGDGETEFGEKVGVDAAGEVVLTGTYVAAGPAPYSTPDGTGVFAARYSASGEPLWSRRFGVWNVNERSVSAVDPQGDVYLGGTFSGKVDFGGGPLETTSGRTLYLAKLDAKGHHVWSKALGGKGSVAVSAIGLDGDGNVLLTGDYNAAADFGGGPLKSFFPAQTPSLVEPYLAKLSRKGDHLWSRSLGSTTAPGSGVALAVAPSGDITVAGGFGTVTEGTASLGAHRMFLARVSSAGAPQWSKVYGGDEGTSVDVEAMAIDPSGALLLTGGYQGVADFGTGALPDSHGWEDIFIAKIAP